MDQIITQFGINPLLLAAQVVNFLVLLFILKRLLYTPLLTVLEKRKAIIAQNLKNAGEIEKRLLEISEEEEKRLLNASKEGEKIIKEAQDVALLLIEEGKIKAGEVAEKVREQSRAQLQLEREKMQLEIREHLAEFIMLGLTKVTGKTLTEGDQKKMIEDSIKGM